MPAGSPKRMSPSHAPRPNAYMNSPLDKKAAHPPLDSQAYRSPGSPQDRGVVMTNRAAAPQGPLTEEPETRRPSTFLENSLTRMVSNSVASSAIVEDSKCKNPFRTCRKNQPYSAKHPHHGSSPTPAPSPRRHESALKPVYPQRPQHMNHAPRTVPQFNPPRSAVSQLRRLTSPSGHPSPTHAHISGPPPQSPKVSRFPALNQHPQRWPQPQYPQNLSPYTQKCYPTVGGAMSVRHPEGYSRVMSGPYFPMYGASSVGVRMIGA